MLRTGLLITQFLVFTLFLFSCNEKINTTIQPKEADVTKEQVHKMMDAWHLSASSANADQFFGFMSENSIYIGTDATERWTKPEFMAFGKPYFDKGKAWDFKAFDRDIHFSQDKNVVWFSELLQTWMGVCRGSGILEKNRDGQYKLTQYHLSVTVPNEQIQEFIDLVESANQPE